ncbi:formate dehydrogenase subunit gamma [Marivita hallyeonensis]|uniref:Formate dehydrogenase gamma subunit n=1 Tax=Marivita hallyeonensis TaxID=996342 RepID=A0A1M5N829_9RHOB|nr:formate dehydrogenase subunit gamma [Marivita hallyeonensis]SHG85637.1 formate dehydrogenase gamma subunit [Marivita hallyeonensis]
MRDARNPLCFLFVAVLALTTLLTAGFSSPTFAQEAAETEIDRSATGGATTLEDIMRRQQGLQTNDNASRASNVGDPSAAAGLSEQLGTLGGASDPDLWRGMRFNAADVTTQVRGPASEVLIQDRGMWWLQFREGPLLTYGGYLLLGTLGFLLLFFLVRGRVRIDGEKTGRRIERFKNFERFGHWLLAGSFILLGITGLVSLMGRKFLIPAFGHDAFAWIAGYSKWVHNNVSWAFMIALVMIFVMWVVHNLPDKTDIKWLAKGGGLFGGGHPPAKKFNAGQKLIFWSVIVLGASISVSGLSLLFPFELPLFAKTFAVLNSTGLPEMLGFGVLPETMTPHEEMQYAQLWHAIVSFVLMAIILAHIYIGSVGMEGAYDAMGSGMVEEQWAKEHHSLWVEEVQKRERDAPGNATPAE